LVAHHPRYEGGGQSPFPPALVWYCGLRTNMAKLVVTLALNVAFWSGIAGLISMRSHSIDEGEFPK
jgi:hypothetical protein